MLLFPNFLNEFVWIRQAHHERGIKIKTLKLTLLDFIRASNEREEGINPVFLVAGQDGLAKAPVPFLLNHVVCH